MSFTTILWVLLYGGAIVSSFVVNPIFGAVGYLLEYYMRPELKWWGEELPGWRYNLIMSVALGISFLMRRNSLREMVRTPNIPLRWLAAMAAIMVFVSATVAINRELSLNWSIQWFKMAVIFPMLIVGVVRTASAFNLFAAAHMLGAFWWGWDAWTRPRRVAGRLINIGSGDTLNDNAASAHLLTVVPFIVLYLLTEKDKRLRAIAVIALPFVVNTIILCNSRGTMVGVAVALAASMFLIRTGYRMRMIGAGVGIALTVLLLADDTFIRRQQTTTNIEEDGSAQQRLASWRGAYELVQDYPLGTGGRGFHLLSPIYIPEVVAAHGGDLRAPHNTFAMVASEWGVLGLVCFIGLNASALGMLRRVKKAASASGNNAYYWRALALQLAIIGHLGASVFTDRLYGEAPYWMIALAFALYRMQRTEAAEARVPVPVPSDTLDPASRTDWPWAGAPAR